VKKQILTIFLFHPTIRLSGIEYVKSHHGKFVDEIASDFDKVYLVAPYFSEEEVPSWMTVGRQTYNYRINSEKVVLVKGITKKIAYPLRLVQHAYYALRSTHLFFFTPSIGSIVLFPFLKVLGKSSYCYVATDPYQYFRALFRVAWVGNMVASIQKHVVAAAKGILATGSGNVLLWEGHPRVVRVSPLLDIEPQQGLGQLPAGSKRERDLLFVGPLVARKRIHPVLEALREQKSKGKHFTFDIIGASVEEGPEYEQKLKQIVADFELESSVCFHGFIGDREELCRFYARSRFFVLLSEFEGFPKVVYEAMMFGAVPILSPLTSYDDFLVDEENCLFVDEADLSGSFERRIASVTEAKLERIRIGNQRFIRKMLTSRPGEQFLEMLRSEGGL
jgi:glycosyltransferase involved in cell wall biosynthesis